MLLLLLSDEANLDIYWFLFSLVGGFHCLSACW